MKNSRALLLILVAGLAACAAAPDAPSSAAPVTAAETDPVAALPPPQAEPEAGDGAVGEGGGPNAGQLTLWRDPAFQRQFQESYLSETDIEPRVTVAERDQMQEVLALIAADQVDGAIASLERRRGGAASAVFDFTLANLYFQQEKLEPAAGAYRIAVQKFPKFVRAWRNLGLVNVRQGEFESAATAFTKVIEHGGADATTYGLLGFSCSNGGNDLAAEGAYRMATLLDPATVDWRMGLARSFFKQQKYADAAALCSDLIERQPDRADLWLLQANAFIGMNQPLRAAENYELVDRLGKSTADSLNMLGDIYTNEELFDLAVGSYVRAIEKSPETRPERAIRAAKVMTARGSSSAGRALIEHIERSQGERLPAEDRKELLKLRARIAVAEGAGEEEARTLEEIVALDPLDGEALLLLGQHESRAARFEKAIHYYERAASLDAFEADAKVRHAQLLVGQSRYAEALPLLRRAQALKPRENIQQYLEQVERVAATK